MITPLKDPVDEMSNEEIKDMCHLLCNVSWSDRCKETLIGCMINTITKDWKCDLTLKPNDDPMESVVIKVIFWPNEIKVTHSSLERAFVKMGQVLGKWKPDPIEPPKPAENAS